MNPPWAIDSRVQVPREVSDRVRIVKVEVPIPFAARWTYRGSKNAGGPLASAKLTPAGRYSFKLKPTFPVKLPKLDRKTVAVMLVPGPAVVAPGTILTVKSPTVMAVAFT